MQLYLGDLPLSVTEQDIYYILSGFDDIGKYKNCKRYSWQVFMYCLFFIFLFAFYSLDKNIKRKSDTHSIYLNFFEKVGSQKTTHL